jgi:hypothetical protein
MCETVKRSFVNPKKYLFHHGLIKLLIVTELKARKNTWNNFIDGNLSMSGRKTGSPTIPTKIKRSLSHTGKKRKVKVIGEMPSLEPEFKKMTRSMTSKNPNLDNPSPELQMKLYIDTDDEIEGGSSAIADVLVNLKKELPPRFSQSSSSPQNPTGLGSPKIISPKKFFKLQTENAHLKENLCEYKVLDRLLKTENTTLKSHLAQSWAQESNMCAQMDKFHSQANTLSFENRKLQSRLNRRYQETRIILIENRYLRKKLHSIG